MEFDSYYVKALRYLTIRLRSEKEMRDYLRKKFLRQAQDKKVDEQIIDLIVTKLTEQKFLDDEAFAKMWIRSRTDFKPKGWRLIKLELRQKGISEKIIKSLELKATHSIKSGQESEVEEKKRDEQDLAKEILEKKRKKFASMGSLERFNKAGSMLGRRGFTLDDIKKAIEEVFEK